jgi:hypothetical protein
VTTMPAPAGEHRDIEAYVAELDRKLRGSYRTKRDMLTEAHDSLIDATAAYQKAGLDPLDAERRAVAEFGDLAEIASGYQPSLGSLRAAALRGWLSPRSSSRPSFGTICCRHCSRNVRLQAASLPRAWTHPWSGWVACFGRPRSPC